MRTLRRCAGGVRLLYWSGAALIYRRQGLWQALPAEADLSTQNDAITDRNLETLLRLGEQAELGGGQRRIEQQRQRASRPPGSGWGRCWTRVRSGRFDRFVTHRATDFGLGERTFLGDAVVTGYGDIDGRQVFAYAQDFTVLGGSLSEAVGQKICKVMDLAAKTGCPMIGICDSGGRGFRKGR